MSAVIKRFDIPMTRKQTHKVQEQWDETHYEPGRVMLAVQPIGGTFRTKYTGPPILRFAVIDCVLADAIQKLLKKHKKARP